MTGRHETSVLRQGLLALGICAALLAQMALPALHAEETRARGRAGAVSAPAAPASAAGVERVDGASPSHDRARCPVCQSLLRTNPGASAVVSHEEPRVALATQRPTEPLRPHAAAVQLGHPPRAPPSPTSSPA